MESGPSKFRTIKPSVLKPSPHFREASSFPCAPIVTVSPSCCCSWKPWFLSSSLRSPDGTHCFTNSNTHTYSLYFFLGMILFFFLIYDTTSSILSFSLHFPCRNQSSPIWPFQWVITPDTSKNVINGSAGYILPTGLGTFHSFHWGKCPKDRWPSEPPG